MPSNGTGQRITVYFGERDTWQHHSLALAFLEMLRHEGCSGATVIRGVAGFGAGSRIKTATLVELSGDLPLVLTVVDTPARVADLLPKISAMLGAGLITVEEVDIYQYSSRFKETLPALPVREVMTTHVITVAPDTPLANAARLLVHHVFTALPVVDAQGHLRGIVEEGDILRVGQAPQMLLSFHKALEAAEPGVPLAQLGRLEGPVEAVMRREVPHVAPEVSIRTAAHLMLTSEVKHLPVVDPAGVLVGIVSRIDLLRTVSAGYLPQEAPLPNAVPTGGSLTVVGEIMSLVVQTVPMETPLSEVVSTLLSSGTQCILVLDAAGGLAGIITPSDVVRRLDPAARPSFLQILRSRLPLAGQEAARQVVRQSTAQQARELMTTPVVSVTPDTPLSTALLLATQQGWKRLPVCDVQQRPLGLVSRKELLGAVLRSSQQNTGTP